MHFDVDYRFREPCNFLSICGQRELSTGLQLQQKDQNHMASIDCCERFLHAALWFNQEHLFRQETRPLTFTFKNYHADLLRTHELHW